MRNRASAKEKGTGSHKILSHGESSLICRSLWLIIFVGIMFLLSGFTFSQGKIERTTLDNGMVVLLKENHNIPLASLFLCVPSGSAQEGKFSGSGIAHFIEHMLFKGTSGRAAGDVFREIESYGGKINAVTSYDYTGFKVTVPSESVYPALEIVADMVMNANFNEQELEKERQVILKEIKLTYDNPQRYASRLLWQTAYSTHIYKNPILGEEHSFKNLGREDLLNFYHKNYTPDNMILSIVGDVDTRGALTFVKDTFRDFQRKHIADFESRPEPKQKELREREEEFTTGLMYLRLGFHSVAITDEDIFALDVLAAVLGNGESSRLHNLLCNKKRLAYSMEAINYTPRDPGLFIISCLLEERNRKRVVSLILKQIELLKKSKISENELESAKNKVISDVLFYSQTIEAQVQDLALNEAISGDCRFTEKYVQKIRQVNSPEVLRVAEKYLKQTNLSIIALTPREEATKSSLRTNSDRPFMAGVEDLTHQADNSSPINTAKGKMTLTEILPNKEENEKIKRYLFDNGLTLLVRENRDLPLVSIKAVFKGGLRVENEQTNGLCNLVAKMLDKGTKTKSAGEIAYLIESKGARLSSFSGNNSFVLSLDALSKDFDQMLASLADLIKNCTFPQIEFKRQKEKNLAKLKAQEDNIFESGKRLLKSILFERHPYKFPIIGNEESLKKLRRRDLIDFYKKFCVGKNMVLGVFGDVDADDVRKQAKELFAEINPGNTPEITPDAQEETKSVRTSFEALAKKQTLLLMGFPGTTVLNQDRFMLEIICQVLSQASGRLFYQIRENTGLAYTLGAYQVLGLDTGYLVIYVATTDEVIETVKKEIWHQLRLLKEEPLSEEELTQAKRAIIAERIIARQTNSACALESSLDELYGLGFNHYLKYADQINGVGAKEIQRCADRYFDLDNYAVVVVGPGKTN